LSITAQQIRDAVIYGDRSARETIEYHRELQIQIIKKLTRDESAKPNTSKTK